MPNANEPARSQRPPRDGVRAVMPGPELEGRELTGRLAGAGEWAEIDSRTEGHFLERNAAGAFRKSFDENRDKIRIIFQHGKDPQLGHQPIAVPRELGEDDQGPFFRGELLDGLPPLIVSGLKAGQYGISHSFRSIREDWEPTPKAGPHNPKRLPERTIRELQVNEISVVTWPAYAGATAQVRSLSDEYALDSLSADPGRLRDLVGYVIPTITTNNAANVIWTPAPSADAGAEPHLELERREPPGSPSPIATQDPPEGGSSLSRSATVEYTSRDDKQGRVTELETAIATRATAFPGVLPADEQARDDAENAERDRLAGDIAAYDARISRVAQFGHRDEPTAPAYVPAQVNQIRQVDPFDFGEVESRARSEEQLQGLFRDNAMRITEQATFPHPKTDVQATRDRMAWLIDNHDSKDHELARRFMATGSPLYQRAFQKMVLGQPLTPEEQRGTALAVGVDATGGFAIPIQYDLSVIAIGSHTGAVNPYRRVCRVVPIVGTDTWNALTATAVVATRTTEAAPATEQGPTFAQPQYIVKRVQAQITYSLETAQDRTDIASEMAVLIGEAKDNEEEASFATGVGTTVFPLGVGPVNGTAGAYTSLTTGTTIVIAAADADLVEAALPVRHRTNAQWFINRTNLRKFQNVEVTGGKLFGGNGYYPAVQSGIATENTGNTGLRLLGYPVNESPSLPSAATTNIVIATLLNPDQYVIVDRIGMSLQIIPFIFGAAQGNLVTGQQALYAMWRNDARPLNVDAGRTLRFL